MGDARSGRVYRINITRAARKDMRKLALETARQVDAEILALSANPRPPDCRKLVTHRDLYRVRVGDYRIIYSIDDPDASVAIARVRHRKDAYREL
jgi:mRNA interferase RelE/StbE